VRQGAFASLSDSCQPRLGLWDQRRRGFLHESRRRDDEALRSASINHYRASATALLTVGVAVVVLGSRGGVLQKIDEAVDSKNSDMSSGPKGTSLKCDRRRNAVRRLASIVVADLQQVKVAIACE